MSETTVPRRQYAVNVRESDGPDGAYWYTFEPKGALQEVGPRGIPTRAPQFIVAVRPAADGWAFDWSDTSDDPGAARAEMEAEVAARMRERQAWIDRVSSLVSQVEEWARDMGWSTRRIDKGLDDARIGRHRVPALLMQQETFRALLEPIGRSSPGAEGVVDLYLLPAYDDIASLYYSGNGWHVRHTVGSANAAAPASKAIALSRESLAKVLAEMRQNAA